MTPRLNFLYKMRCRKCRSKKCMTYVDLCFFYLNGRMCRQNSISLSGNHRKECMRTNGYINIYLYTCKHGYLCIYINIQVYMDIYVCVHIYIYTYTHIYAWICSFVINYIYICAYVWHGYIIPFQTAMCMKVSACRAKIQRRKKPGKPLLGIPLLSPSKRDKKLYWGNPKGPTQQNLLRR